MTGPDWDVFRDSNAEDVHSAIGVKLRDVENRGFPPVRQF